MRLQTYAEASECYLLSDEVYVQALLDSLQPLSLKLIHPRLCLTS
jgi:hypothetical protein